MKASIKPSHVLSTGIIASIIMLSACGSDNKSRSNMTQTARDTTTSELVATVTQQQIDSAMTDKGIITLTGLAACDVELHQVTYPSKGVNGEAVMLSAALSIPSGPDCQGPFPLLAKGHGTRTLATHTEADIGNAIADHGFFAAHGYVVISPDYLGLGESDYSYHPYLHRDTEAQSMIDAIRAARTTISKLNNEVELSGKVMLAGYSQGGHTVMATQRLIEASYAEEFNLVASAPMSGPYKLEETFLNGVNPDIHNIAAGTLLSYTIQSYQNIYNNIYHDLDDTFRPQYSNVVSTKFPGDSGVFELILGGIFPTTADQYLQPDYLNTFIENANHSFRIALRKNEVLDDFVPKAPMIMCGSSEDGTVPFFNTEKAEQYFQSKGITVPVIDVATLVQVPQGSDSGLTHHIQGNPLCYAMIKARLLDPAK
jgi:pimeloyl-ACP methyl ester carboxylesterase